ncbi:MAG TPA: hypothetical protein VF221_05060 [Chloroflexota bacterium]
MNQEKVARLSHLSAVQIAALAIVGSTVAALSVLFGLRGMGIVRSPGDMPVHDDAPQPMVDTTVLAPKPRHFTEDIVIPGKTFTGADVLEQDDRLGRSPEGV